MNFEQNSYSVHEKDLMNKLPNEDLIKEDFESVFNPGTLFRWKYERILNNLKPLFKLFPSTKWLTIGDGRYGSDASYIQLNTDSESQVIASDISTYLLEYSKKQGMVNKIRKENSESIGLKDNATDFTLCKESFHHFPRPNLALYEMLRVSKKGIILIEPTDYFTNQSIFKQIILKIAKPFLKKKGIKILEDSYENVGNYIYRLSKNELKKIALGLNLPIIAFKGINDYNGNNPKAKIKFLDFLSKLKILSENLTMAIIFKEEIDDIQIAYLKSNGFDVIKLSRNPYLK